MKQMRPRLRVRGSTIQSLAPESYLECPIIHVETSIEAKTIHQGKWQVHTTWQMNNNKRIRVHRIRKAPRPIRKALMRYWQQMTRRWWRVVIIIPRLISMPMICPAKILKWIPVLIGAKITFLGRITLEIMDSPKETVLILKKMP